MDLAASLVALKDNLLRLGARRLAILGAVGLVVFSAVGLGSYLLTKSRFAPHLRRPNVERLEPGRGGARIVRHSVRHLLRWQPGQRVAGQHPSRTGSARRTRFADQWSGRVRVVRQAGPTRSDELHAGSYSRAGARRRNRANHPKHAQCPQRARAHRSRRERRISPQRAAVIGFGGRAVRRIAVTISRTSHPPAGRSCCARAGARERPES